MLIIFKLEEKSFKCILKDTCNKKLIYSYIKSAFLLASQNKMQIRIAQSNFETKQVFYD